MSNIKEFLTADHRKCDNLFAIMEEVATTSLKDAKEACEEFVKTTNNHFDMEEKVMFVEFEKKTGMVEGPTMIMKHEHAQVRKLMDELLEAIDNDNKDKFFGLSETLMILLQQHNMKEEQMLYPMAQQHLSSTSQEIVEMMKNIPQG